MISVSGIPGGNPVALGNPEMFAASSLECSDCGWLFCDRCFTAPPLGRPTCRSCGGALGPGDDDRPPRADRLPDAAFYPYGRGR